MNKAKILVTVQCAFNKNPLINHEVYSRFELTWNGIEVTSGQNITVCLIYWYSYKRWCYPQMGHSQDMSYWNTRILIKSIIFSTSEFMNEKVLIWENILAISLSEFYYKGYCNGNISESHFYYYFKRHCSSLN
jgi:hypothetical protein